MAISIIHEAKTNLSSLIERAERGEEVIIARGKEPVVRLVPIKKPAKKRQLGIYKGEFNIAPEFFDPLPSGSLRVGISVVLVHFAGDVQQHAD
jgi:prevent-host-death family protein